MADGSIGMVEPGRDAPRLTPEGQVPASKEAHPPAGTGTGSPGDAVRADPLRGLIEKMERTQPLVAKLDPSLAAVVRSVAAQADAPGRLGDERYRTRAAYLLQDLEKLAGPVSGVQPGLRDEMAKLAATAPGLQNDRMQALVSMTAGLDDKALVRSIRQGASDMVKAGDQGSADAQSKVDVLENRVRLATRMPAPAEAGPGAKERDGGRVAGDIAPASQSAAAPAAAADVAGAPGRTGPAAGPASPPSPVGRPPLPQLPGGARQQPGEQVHQVQGAGAVFAVLAGLRRPEPPAPAAWDNQLTPLGGRLAAHVGRVQAGKDEDAMRAAEASGQAAAQALQAFSAGPGAGIMSKIGAAAKANPDGMAGVVAGMREGGPYEDLRRGFNADLVQEKGLAASLDRAAKAVGQYSKDRAVVAQATGATEAVAAVASRFERLDAAIGKAASETPGSKDGRSLADELGEKVAGLARRAVEAVRGVFTRTPGAERNAAGPSPSMG